MELSFDNSKTIKLNPNTIYACTAIFMFLFQLDAIFVLLENFSFLISFTKLIENNDTDQFRENTFIFLSVMLVLKFLYVLSYLINFTLFNFFIVFAKFYLFHQIYTNGTLCKTIKNKVLFICDLNKDKIKKISDTSNELIIEGFTLAENHITKFYNSYIQNKVGTVGDYSKLLNNLPPYFDYVKKIAFGENNKKK